ncbi:beta-lactamase family protein [Flavihumibacter rivuli]|uniref:serine hydrolase domain-containing protein n=1 Tax=Flavihumibacter rivuli TaxID=2838156 RepID=UPI001BDE7840|nr:serine hydrolase domain-containing protein [Flavihumibacter rivuli]ULQ55986.1 beta-lactamase family protein [Flavihumibacter rivuli]
MKASLFKGLVLLVLSLPIAISSIAQKDRADSALQAILRQRKVAGLSVAVVRHNQLVYTNSVGYKNLEAQTPLTDDCIFRIASISKSFSATAIMQLVEKGRLSLDDDLSKLVGFTVRNPKYPDVVITLRHALSHRSSINDSQGYFTLDAINPAKNPNWAKCYNDYAPGNGYQYCNLNFNMVGTIIEKFSGERFDQYVKHHILDPLGLYGGYCVDSLDASRFATIYEYRVDSARFIPSPGAYAPRREEIANYVMGYSTPVFSPTGGMKISAPDLARYMMMHMNWGKGNGKRIMKKKSSVLMQTPLSADEEYGLALHKANNLVPGVELVGHTGSAYGLFSAMFFDPKKKSGIVVISNGCDPTYAEGYNAVIREAVNALYQSLLAE